MLVHTATAKSSCGASIGVGANSLRLTRKGRYITYICASTHTHTHAHTHMDTVCLFCIYASELSFMCGRVFPNVFCSRGICRHTVLQKRSQDSVVGIATGYGLDDRGVGVPSPGRVKKNFLFSTLSMPALGSTQPPIQWVPGDFSSRVK
jgi:hypothetical protein